MIKSATTPIILIFVIHDGFTRSIFVSHFKEFNLPFLTEPFIEICNIQEATKKGEFIEYAQGLNRIGLDNKTYGELATLYEKYKKLELASMVGLFHYRRFLIFNPDSLDGCEVSTKFWEGNYRGSWENRKQIIDNQKDLIPKFDNKLVLPNPRLISENQNIWSDFVIAHPNLESLLTLACREWENHFPNSNVEDWLKSSRTMYLFNIFYGPKNFVTEWCNSIFPILTKIDRTLPTEEKEKYSRWAGYISERIFSFYVQQKSICDNFEIVHLPVIHFRELDYESKVNNLKLQLNNAEQQILGFVNSKSWKITKPFRILMKFSKFGS
jgi:hypothetical protein